MEKAIKDFKLSELWKQNKHKSIKYFNIIHEEYIE